MLGDAEYGWYDPSYNGYNILNLGASAFTEDKNTVVIRNTKYGYEDLTLTINKDGKLVVDNNNNCNSGGNNSSDNKGSTTGTVTVPTELPKIEKTQNGSGNSYYLLTFSNASEWLKQN